MAPVRGTGGGHGAELQRPRPSSSKDMWSPMAASAGNLLRVPVSTESDKLGARSSSRDKVAVRSSSSRRVRIAHDSVPGTEGFHASASSTSATTNSQDERVRICVRVRPMSKAEERQGDQEAVLCAGECGNSLQLVCATARGGEGSAAGGRRGPGPSVHCFDAVLAETALQPRVYSLLGEPVVRNVVDGFHGCVFAYGQTGSGKSHTIFGGADEERGLVPRIAEGLFAELGEGETNIVRLSYLELYNEKVRDLLQPATEVSPPARGEASLEVREHPRLGIFVEGLTKNVVRSAKDVVQLLDFGHKIRIVGCTNFNAMSSRSHAVVTLHVECTVVGGSENTKDGAVRRRAHLHAVDLAGSERLKNVGDSQVRQNESKQINKSLLALSTMISRLTSGATQHIPYRDSKLTFLLSSSLMGNCRSAMVACVSPSSASQTMTESTIHFAESVKHIRTRPVKNEDFVGDLVRMLRAEVEGLRKQLLDATGNDAKSHRYADIQDKIQATKALQEEISRPWEEQVRWSMDANQKRRSTLSKLGLQELQSSSTLMIGTREESTPYLVNICDDPLLSGRLTYSLPPGEKVRIGSGPNCAVRIDGLGVQSEMCSLMCFDAKAVEVHLAGIAPSGAVEFHDLSPETTGFEPSVVNGSNYVGQGGDDTTPQPQSRQMHRRGSLFKSNIAEVYVNKVRVQSRRRVDDGDRLRVGLTHCFQVCIPEARGQAHDTAMRIIDDMTAERTDEKSLAKEYAVHLEARIGPRRAAKVLQDLLELQFLVKEANDMTDELRGGEAQELVFKVHVLTDVTGTEEDPELAVALRCMERPDVEKRTPRTGLHDAPGEASLLLAVWSAVHFRQRLDVMRDLYQEVSGREAPWGEPQDPNPWKEDSRIPVVGRQRAGSLSRGSLVALSTLIEPMDRERSSSTASLQAPHSLSHENARGFDGRRSSGTSSCAGDGTQAPTGELVRCKAELARVKGELQRLQAEVAAVQHAVPKAAADPCGSDVTPSPSFPTGSAPSATPGEVGSHRPLNGGATDSSTARVRRNSCTRVRPGEL